MSRRLALLRVLCLLLLAVGTVVRPLLIVGCEIHAASFDHAAQPHEHAHENDAVVDTHGDHDAQLGSLAGAIAPVPVFEFAALAFPPEPVPALDTQPPPERRTAAPFRPPIA